MTSTNKVVANAMASKNKEAVNAQYDKEMSDKTWKQAEDKWDEVMKTIKGILDKFDALYIQASDASSLYDSTYRLNANSEGSPAIKEASKSYASKMKKIAEKSKAISSTLLSLT